MWPRRFALISPLCLGQRDICRVQIVCCNRSLLLPHELDIAEQCTGEEWCTLQQSKFAGMWGIVNKRSSLKNYHSLAHLAVTMSAEMLNHGRHDHSSFWGYGDDHHLCAPGLPGFAASTIQRRGAGKLPGAEQWHQWPAAQLTHSMPPPPPLPPSSRNSTHITR